MTTTTPDIAARAARLGIICAVGAALSFSLNDMLIKFLSGGYPLHQIILVRGVIGLIVLAAVIAPMEGAPLRLTTKRPGIHALRAVTVVFANMAFYLSIAALPLADATAIFFVSPLLITGLSVLLLKEKVGWRRWAAVVVGLIGVLIVIRPTPESFQPAAILPAIAALGYALHHILTRKIGVSERASTMTGLLHIAFVIVALGFFAVAGDGRYATGAHPSLDFLLAAWAWPTWRDFGVMCVIGLIVASGGYLITQAYRTTEAGLLAPFEYVALVMSIIWGFVVFGEVPTPLAATGMALVLCAGLFTALREAGLGKTPSAKRTSARR